MKIILHGNAYSTNNIYYHHGCRAFIKAKPAKLKKSYQEQAQEQWGADPLGCNLEVNIGIYFGDKRKRDWDNYHKLAMDSLTGIVWEDDSQIKKATVSLGYDKNDPRIEIEVIIKELDSLDSKK